MDVLVQALDILSTESKPLGLKFSWIKTKIREFIAFFDENIDPSPPVTVQGKLVSFFDCFVYLGSGVRSLPEINRNLGISLSLIIHLTTVFGGVDT